MLLTGLKLWKTRLCSQVQKARGSHPKRQKRWRKSILSSDVSMVVEPLEDRVLLSTLALHSGDSDPATEGWVYQAPAGSAVSTGPVINDLGTGINAWFVDDSGTVPSVDLGSYQALLTNVQISDALTNGWKLTTRLRAVATGIGSGGTTSDSVATSVLTGSISYNISVEGQEGNADLLVRASGGTSILLAGIGDGYHVFEMEFDPATATTDISVDGNIVITNYAGTNAVTPPMILFGSGDSRSTGRGHFNLVEFESLSAVQTVEIDVRSTLNLASNGKIAVSLFTTDDFDAATADVSTIFFAGASVVQSSLEDVDGDGDLDLVLHFNVADTNLAAVYAQLLTDDIDEDGVLDSNNKEVEVSLTGETTGGQSFEGFDNLDLFLSGKNLRNLLEELAALGLI